MQIKIKRAATGSELLSFRGLVHFRVTEAGRMECRFDESQQVSAFARRLFSVVGFENVSRLGNFTVSFPSGHGCFGLLDFDVEDERYAG